MVVVVNHICGLLWYQMLPRCVYGFAPIMIGSGGHLMRKKEIVIAVDRGVAVMLEREFYGFCGLELGSKWVDFRPILTQS